MVLLEGTLAFLANEVRDTILEHGESLPKLPFKTETEAAVLFVDISGFTELGKKYRKECTDEFEATDKLSNQIMSALATLTQICLDWGGDVVKFAGDALLCTWKVTEELDVSEALKYARRASYEMMMALKTDAHDLELHGGIGAGSLLQFHLGERALRWHLVAGTAMLQAAKLLKMSPKGAILYQDELSRGYSAPGGLVDQRLETYSATGPGHRITTETQVKLNVAFAQNYTKNGNRPLPRNSKMLHDNGLYEETVLSYIPSKLRQKLEHESGDLESGEIMANVATMFVSLDAFVLTPEEIDSCSIDTRKLQELNESFITMTRIVDSYRGQVRDLLFDDKGCVFIAVFGVHTGEEMSALRCVRAARDISDCVPKSRIGVSVGPCFSGLCGTPDRHVFVVMGHDVNQAARFMGGAEVGKILVCDSVKEATESFVDYEKFTFERKGEKFKCWKFNEEIARSGTFIAAHRGGIQTNTYNFVGRRREYAKLERLCQDDHIRALLISGQEGVGKSALAEALKNRHVNSFAPYFATSFVLAEHHSYFVVQQLVAKLLGIYDNASPRHFAQKDRAYEMSRPRNNAMLKKLNKLGVKYNDKVIRYFLPSVKSFMNGNNNRTELRRRMVRYRREEMMKTTKTPNIPKETERVLLEFLKDLIQKRENPDLDCMFIIEDLQWIDTPSLSLLCELIKSNLPGCRFIFVTRPLRMGMSRERKRQKIIENLIQEVLNMKECEHIDIHNLDYEDTTQLICEVIRTNENEDVKVCDLLLNNVWKRTKGHPMHLVLLIEWMKNQSLIVQGAEDNTFLFNTAKGIEMEKAVSHIPVDLVHNIRHRVDNLPGESYRLLKLAAIVGIRFSQRLLEKIWETEYGNDEIATLSANFDILHEHGMIMPAAEKINANGIFSIKVKPFLKSRMARLMNDADLWEFQAGIYRDVVLKGIPAKRLHELCLAVEQARLDLSCISKVI